ncbi:hypothetical protein FE634_21585 [Nocardioides dongxiaopingii]|uniref:hypothetical protein n=1 Tax=Nocardioides sp. S-1144 TaxID=2582905 RepID=UPI001162BB45|nr:hypothetical protein [Nocardioides sp. S-1144]QDH10786.1 hypothetical protein FE634_21585 [Nocardioides sp. S-1144]
MSAAHDVRARARHAVVAALLTGVVVLGLPLALVAATAAAGAPGAPAAAPSSSPTDTASTTADPTDPPATTSPATPQTGAFEVDDAQLRWAVNDETNNRAFAPGTVNFLSAGKVPDPGRGGQTIVDGAWRGTGTRAWQATAGDVRIEKQRPDGGFATATWPGLSTTVAGTTMSGTNGPFSGHQVVLDGGTGQVDADAGTATITWRGSFSVVYYSGMTFFTVSDPVLTVTRTGATLRATLAGYASSMEDQSIWRPVPPRQVDLANLPRVDLGRAGGFVATPRYLGVRHDGTGDDPAQVRTGPAWGAFPASYLAFMRDVGSAAYWYSSGGSADAHKVPEPIAVSYEAGAPVEPPTDPVTETPEPGGTASPTTPVNPTPPPSPSPSVPARPPAPALPPQPSASTPPPDLTGPGGSAAAATSAPGPAHAAPTVYAHASSDTATAPGPHSGLHWTWFAGSALLLAAAAVTLLSNRVKGPA